MFLILSIRETAQSVNFVGLGVQFHEILLCDGIMNHGVLFHEDFTVCNGTRPGTRHTCVGPGR